jgi:hypothetical protein
VNPTTEQPAVQNILGRMDERWGDFSKRVHAMRGEHFSTRIGEGAWNRKQMLGHITTWHEITIDRLMRFAESGEPNGTDEDEDVINARAARGAEGRTTGEVVQSMEDSYRRLRREVARLTDAQLAAHDSWAAAIIAGNSYGHYEEHLPDLAG